MKKLLTGVLALALALSVVAPAAASAQTSASYTFNTNLTVGSRGADVVALQTFLESKGLLTIPAGTAKGYFGGLTRSAVAAYQTMKGITPNAGYFGPITRAAVMADSSTSVGTPGCPAGAMFNSITGQPCSSTPVTPGCPAGALYNSQTGQPCSSVSPISPTGEGTLDVRLAASPADNANIQTSTDVPVYGIEFRARLADVAVQTVDLQVKVVNGSSEENPSTLINTIKLWDGSSVLATINVNSGTFTKDSNGDYYIRVTGLNFVVPKDATKTLTVSFSTNSIDNSRVVTVDGYQSNSVRAVSGNGVNSFYSIDSLSKVHTFKKPGNSTLTVSTADREIRSKNIYASTTKSITPERVELTAFNVRSSTGDSNLDQVSVLVSSSSAPQLKSLELYDGSTLLSSRSVPASGVVTFDNFDYNVSRDVTRTLTIKGNFDSNGTNASTLSVNVTGVEYEQPTGSSVSLVTSVTGATHYVFTSSPEFSLASNPTVVVQGSNASGSNTSLTATFEINVTPRGGSMAIPTVLVAFGTTTDRATAIANSAPTTAQVSVADGSTTLPEDSAKRLVVTATLFNASVPQSGTYNAFVEQINWSVAGNAQNQTWGFEDYKTTAGAAFNK
jgi:peptidoglycan hydrolase-like protein with peptidoglycan-binding domain